MLGDVEEEDAVLEPEDMELAWSDVVEMPGPTTEEGPASSSAANGPVRQSLSVESPLGDGVGVWHSNCKRLDGGWNRRWQNLNWRLATLMKMEFCSVSEKSRVCRCGRQNFLLLLAFRLELTLRSHHTIDTTTLLNQVNEEHISV